MNAVFVRGPGRGESAKYAKKDLVKASFFMEDSARITASRWNRYEGYRDAASQTKIEELQQVGRADLEKGRPQEDLYCTFLSTPGSDDAPRSLYGLDWDLGDRVRVSYAGLYKTAEIMIVYVSINDRGEEEVTGRSDVGDIG